MRKTMKTTVDQMVVMIPMILLLVETPCNAGRRFCEKYPYARRCLGVAAKRSPSRTDIYKSLINKVLAETLDENLPRETSLPPAQQDLFEDRTGSLKKLANFVLAAERKHDRRKAFTDPDDTWSEQFGEYDGVRRA